MFSYLGFYKTSTYWPKVTAKFIEEKNVFFRHNLTFPSFNILFLYFLLLLLS